MTHGNSHMETRKEARDSLDDFPTPPWATRAVLDYVATDISIERLSDLTAREPCCNRGHMVRPLQEYFRSVDAFDVHDYGIGAKVRDFLFPDPLDPVDWTVMNPPFRLAVDFIKRARETSRKGVIVICRTAFLDGEERAETLFLPHRPTMVLQFSERVPMLRGRLVRKGEVDLMAAKPGTKASTATAYAAFIWTKDRPVMTGLDWIPKVRLDLEIDGDYPCPPDGPAVLWKPLDGA